MWYDRKSFRNIKTLPLFLGDESDQEVEKKEVEGDEMDDVENNAEDIAKLLGFGVFGSTKVGLFYDFTNFFFFIHYFFNSFFFIYLFIHSYIYLFYLLIHL
jgi:hypothetical protein